MDKHKLVSKESFDDSHLQFVQEFAGFLSDKARSPKKTVIELIEYYSTVIHPVTNFSNTRLTLRDLHRLTVCDLDVMGADFSLSEQAILRSLFV
jgi:hypothetical protein